MGEELRVKKCFSSIDWDWFVTFTFDRNRVDSSSYDVVVTKLSDYLNSLKKRICPNLKYLFVPELHKDGIHYYFYGLIADCGSLDFVNSGHDDCQSGKPIYSMANWSWGFSSVTEVESSDIALLYMSRKRRVFNYSKCLKCGLVWALTDECEEFDKNNRNLLAKLEECQTELQQYKAYCVELESKLCEYSKKGGFNHELQEMRK